MRHPKLRQHLGKNGPRRKSVRQETVPGLEERVRPRRERVSVGREIDGVAAIVGSGTQVDHHRPLTPQRSKYGHAERPFGTGELVRTGERESARTLRIPGMNCGASRIRRDSAQWRIPWATVLRAGDRVPPPPHLA